MSLGLATAWGVGALVILWRHALAACGGVPRLLAVLRALSIDIGPCAPTPSEGPVIAASGFDASAHSRS